MTRKSHSVTDAGIVALSRGHGHADGVHSGAASDFCGPPRKPRHRLDSMHGATAGQMRHAAAARDITQPNSGKFVASNAGRSGYPGLRARNVTPVVSKFLADDSCFEPEKTSIFLPHWTSTNPAASRTHSHSASSRAPAIQPDQRSISSLADCGTSICTVISAICARPPGFRTR